MSSPDALPDFTSLPPRFIESLAQMAAWPRIDIDAWPPRHAGGGELLISVDNAHDDAWAAEVRQLVRAHDLGEMRLTRRGRLWTLRLNDRGWELAEGAITWHVLAHDWDERCHERRIDATASWRTCARGTPGCREVHIEEYLC